MQLRNPARGGVATALKSEPSACRSIPCWAHWSRCLSFAYLPLFTGDYLRDTRGLSPLRHGVYLLALIYCWDSKDPMPLDEQECAGICNCRSADEIEALRYVLNRFFVRMDDGHYNKRIQVEIERSEAISRERSEAGRKGYQAKAKQLLSKSLAKAKQVPLSPSPSPSPSSNPSQEVQQATLARAQEHPECPHLEVLKAWSESLPALPAHEPALWKGTRQAHLRARWRETAALKGWKTQDEGIRYFRKLFEYIGSSRFLTGKVNGKGDRPAFQAELEWVVKPGNWAKIIEGKYHAESV